MSEFEQGYRHGKRDFAAGLRSPTLLDAHGDYADGYREGIEESETIYADWIAAQH